MTKLKTNRSMILYFLLTAITCGIWSFVFVHKQAKDLNVVCAEDGKKTGGFVKYLILTPLTLGIYGIIWWCASASRVKAYGARHNVNGVTGAASLILWTTIGSMLFGLGPFIAIHKYMKSTNRICKDFMAREKAAKEAEELAAQKAAEEAALAAKRAEEEAALAAKRAEEEAALAAKRAKEDEERAAQQAAMVAAAVAQALAAQNAAQAAQAAPAAPAAAPEAPAAPAAEEAPAQE